MKHGKYIINQNISVLITCLLEHAIENRVWVWGGISIFRMQNALTTHSGASEGHSVKTPSPVVGEGSFSRGFAFKGFNALIEPFVL